MNSSFLNLNWKDFGKGLLVAVLSAVLGAIYTSVQAGVLTFDWKAIGGYALTAGLGYIMKNLFQNQAGAIGPEK
jgi:hypothetical protein